MGLSQAGTARQIRKALVDWYPRAARDLPWRRTRDPYAIWLSEVMLQQTRVETVIPYFERFLQRFPTTTALAHATEDEVLALWSGLGYYRRARLLHQGVKDVVSRYGGVVPVDSEQRASLPGVGRYTAGAIGSIAFGRPEPVVDGNVARVLSRVYEITSPLGQAETEAELWSRAAQLVDGPEPGAFNQALMELGATVCTRSNPKCLLCPISKWCVARQNGTHVDLPRPRKRAAPKKVHVTAVAAIDRKAGVRTWFIKQEGSLFGGLWGFPTAEGHGHRSAVEALRRANIEATLSSSALCQVEHVLSHRRLSVELWSATVVKARQDASRQALSVRDVERFGVSRLTQKLHTRLARSLSDQ